MFTMKLNIVRKNIINLSQLELILYFSSASYD